MNTKNFEIEQASRLFNQVRSVSNRCFVTLFALAILLIAATTASAQISGTGSIQGTVSDQTGAVIAGASVDLTNDATQVKHVVTSGRDGLYSFPNIDIGTYTLTVTSDGFKTYTQQRIILEVGSSIGINVPLSVGSTSEKVEVQAGGIALQTEDVSFKQTIDQTTLTELPLNGRNITSLIALSGASVPSSGLTQGNKGFFSSVSPQIAGGQGNQTDYRLDGGDNNDYESNTSFAFPFPDAVAQFSVETAASGAQTGLHPAGVVNVVTRSGSNSWHGSAFDFIRNNYINATNFYSGKDTLHQNQYGGTFGGRIIRDKLFFFGGYQRLSSSASSAGITARVPTAAMLQGNFLPSEITPCITTAPVQLFNPINGALLPNDSISPTFYNSASLALLQYLPPAIDACGNTAKFSIPVFQTENQFITRIDSVLTSRHSLYGRFFRDGYITPALYSPTNLLVTANPGNTEVAQALTIGETWTISSTLVNTIHLTGTRRTNTRGPAAQGLNAASVGIPSSAVYQPYAIGFRIQGPGFTPYCSTCAKGTFNVNSWSIIDDANKVIGKHQLVFGGEYIRAQLNVNNSFSSNGTFNFSNVFSQKGPAQTITSIPSGTLVNGATPIQGGQSLLDFLSGSMTSFSQSKPQQNAMRAPIPSLYIQDTYHATKRLVISAGIRWSAQFTPYDYFGRGSSFDYGAFNANQHSTRFPNAPAGSSFYGDPGLPKNFTKNYIWQFTPRLGVTFDPAGDGKTVFRAGAGLVYDETNFFASTETTQNAPFATLTTNTATTAPISFSNPWVGGTAPGNPYPQPFVPLSTQTFGPGGQYIVYPKEFPTPYVLQWTASIQHELPHGWQFQIDYIANKTTHSPYGYPLSPVLYMPGTWSGPGSCVTASGLALATTASPGTGKACSSTGNSQSRALLTLQNPTQGPFYLGGGGGGASTLMVAGANARYDGMVANIQHRASKSFTFLANYTWSHCYDLLDNPGAFNTVAVQNPFNPKADYAACGFDRRAIFNSAIVASSHFSGLSGWRAFLINNWEIAPIIRATSGAPFSATSGQDNSLQALNTDRPNYNGGNIYLHTHPNTCTTQCINPNSLDVTKFSENPLGTFGNSPRNGFVGPKFFNIDSSFSRSFPLYEQVALSLRLEAFNVLNHPNFGNPAANVFSPTTFGRVTSAQAPRIFQVAAKITF